MDRLTEIAQRLAEINEELRTEDADIDALETEVTALENERAAINERAARRTALLTRAATASADGRPTVRPGVPVGTEGRTEEQVFDAASDEYRTAWLKRLAHNEKTDEWRLGTMTEVEKRAWTYLTTNTTAVIPTGIQLGIVDLISERYALLGDLSPSGFAGVVEFQQAGPIVSGEAAETNENIANSDNLKITFTKVTMSGVEIKGSVKIGRKMQLQSIDGFETWLKNELARELGQRMNDHAWDAIDDDMTAGNKSTPDELDDVEIRSGFGKLKGGEGSRFVYANNSTIWNHIAGVVDQNGREKFIESSVADDPAVQGRIYGTTVKLDDTLADGVIFIGYPATVKANTFEAPNVLTDVNVESREVTHAGYALFEARLGDTRSWAKITITEASA